MQRRRDAATRRVAARCYDGKPWRRKRLAVAQSRCPWPPAPITLQSRSGPVKLGSRSSRKRRNPAKRRSEVPVTGKRRGVAPAAAPPPGEPSWLIFAGVVACFFLSGLAALLYQTAWLRQFSLVFGTSELAVATVLAAYMGGLALGSAVAARYAGRVTRPVLVYGILEAGIALSALAVPVLLLAARALYASMLGDQPAPPDAATIGQPIFYLLVAFVVLAIPTGFMGATLPLLIRYAVRTDRQVGPRVALLYSINTAGAVCGTVAAAFVLLPALGLNRTVWVGVAVNALVFVIAAALARGRRDSASADETVAAAGPAEFCHGLHTAAVAAIRIAQGQADGRVPRPARVDAAAHADLRRQRISLRSAVDPDADPRHGRQHLRVCHHACGVPHRHRAGRRSGGQGRRAPRARRRRIRVRAGGHRRTLHGGLRLDGAADSRREATPIRWRYSPWR